VERFDSVDFHNIPYYMLTNNIRVTHTPEGSEVTYICDQCNNETKIHDESVIPFYGNPIEYYYVTEYDDENGNKGKTEYTINGQVNLQDQGSRPYATPFATNWRSGMIKKKSVYKGNGNNSYTLIQQDSSQYESTYPYEFVTDGFKAEYFTYCADKLIDYVDHSVTEVNFQTESFHLKNEVTKLYDNNGFLKDTTSLVYGSTAHTLPTETDKLNSKGEVLKEKTKYSFDYSSSTYSDNTSIAIKKLKQNNHLVPIEKLTTKTISGTEYVVGGTLFTYDTTGLNPYKVYQLKTNTLIPLSSFTQSSIGGDGNFVKDSHYEERAEFTAYDHFNNPLQEHYTNNIDQSFIWDYDSMYLAAQVTNANQSSIAYTSFEAENPGNWSGINSSYVQTGYAITGSKYYRQTSFSLSKSGLTSSNYYTVSYWSANGSYSISGTQTGYPKTLNSITVGDTTWTLYEHLITGQSTISITGSGAIDELRLYPRGALMTTYTYNPLIGISSQSDPLGRIVYYSYDNLGRLQFIRDQNQKVLKKNDYKYASGQ